MFTLSINRRGIAGSYGESMFDLIFGGATRLLPKRLCRRTFPPTVYDGSDVAVFMPTRICFRLRIRAFLVRGKCYLLVVLICISLMANDMELPSMCLLHICVSSLGKCVFRSFVLFLN